jgi:hypothetical protein
MSEAIAYLVSCEILCGEGSDGAEDGMEGAFVIVGVMATDEENALVKINASFADEGYEMHELEWISEADDMEWEEGEGEAEANDILARLANEPDTVQYGPLYGFSDEISEAA